MIEEDFVIQCTPSVDDGIYLCISTELAELYVFIKMMNAYMLYELYFFYFASEKNAFYRKYNFLIYIFKFLLF